MQAGLRRLREDPALRTAVQDFGWYLVTDGTDVCLRHGTEAIERLLDRGQLSFGFVVELTSIRAELRAQLAQAS
jgi:hypothetical protein